MSKVGQQVLEDFYKRLGENAEVGKDVLARLQALFASGKKLKPEDFEAVLANEEKGALP